MIEKRFSNGHVKIEKREEGQSVLVGYGAVFHREGDAGTEYQLWPGLVERVGTNAFNRAISEKQDVRGLFNHDANFVLGRTKSNTMKLSVDSVGLRYEIELDDDAESQRIAKKIERGDIDGSSFSFRPTAVRFEELDNGTEVRILEDVDLYDVGPVTFPAYEGTTAGSRSQSDEAIMKEWESWKQEKAQRSTEMIAAEHKQRVAELTIGDSDL